MKLPVGFLLCFFVLFSQQQRLPYQFQSRVLTPWNFHDHQFSDNDLYSYLLARRLAQSAYPVLPQLDAYAENRGILLNAPQPSEDLSKQTEGRVNGFVRDPTYDQINPRFLLNYATTAGSSYNPLIKTVYYFTSSVITTTTVTTCIPATHFVAASSTIVCRKRREVLELLKQINYAENKEESNIAPTAVEHTNVQPTAVPAASLRQVDLVSSKDEKHPGDLHDSTPDSPRVKRLFGGLFYSTTTLTSYVLSTTSSTRTLSTLVTTSALSCRPSNFIVC